MFTNGGYKFGFLLSFLLGEMELYDNIGIGPVLELLDGAANSDMMMELLTKGVLYWLLDGGRKKKFWYAPTSLYRYTTLRRLQR